MMSHPDLPTLEDLPKPHYDQLAIVKLYIAEAKQCRVDHSDWILHPKETLTDYFNVIEGPALKWQTSRYRHVVNGQLQPFYRCTVTLPLSTPISFHGDAPDPKRAEKTAGLHALLYLVRKKLISDSGLPTFLTDLDYSLLHRPRSTSDSSSSRSSTASLTDQFVGKRNTDSQDSQPAPEGLPTLGDIPADGPSWKPAYDADEEAARQAAEAFASKISPKARHSPPPNKNNLSLVKARAFIDFYCKKFKYKSPNLTFNDVPQHLAHAEHHASLSIDGRLVGRGDGSNMKEATSKAYLDAAAWMAESDLYLWTEFEVKYEGLSRKSEKSSSDTLASSTYVPPVRLNISDALDDKLRKIIWDARNSELHKQALISREKAEEEAERFRMQQEATKNGETLDANSTGMTRARRRSSPPPWRVDTLRNKSITLQERQKQYQTDPRHAKMRETRASLPISSHTQDLLQEIEANPVVVVMAQTGSGKTTQLPQIILDDYIAKGKGAECNIVCTQPRRLAAISVAQRVAAERGEKVGSSVGYQVRFERTFPERDGSILFMTSGIFLKRMQVGLEDLKSGKSGFLDEVSHVIVDEVHERDIDVDLLLFILRRQLEERRRAGRREFKVILMSATIDPTLFRNYFTNPLTALPAPAVTVPGRTYPVEKYYLDDIYNHLRNDPRLRSFSWVFDEKEVQPYLQRELQKTLDPISAARTDDDLRFPAPLVALVVAMVADRTSQTRDGHILVFLPGLDEIKNVQKALLQSNQSMFGIDFARYEMHILHSEVPVAEQQLVFTPARPGVQRIILATNIAETSVTIPDVVYVVDAGKCKEKRFDPQRHMSSLVQAFTGIGNMGQRAGRAGRHRPGEYFSLVSHSRLRCLPQNQTVEMKRLDLSNVVMHVKGLNLPMEVEDVLDECIEPPGRERVVAAIKSLERVGALDENKNLTALGKVLLHLPVEAAIGKLCLLGCFFNCLDQVLTIAALLTNRDPFMAPLDRRFEANKARRRFCPPGYISDILTALHAYNQWDSLPNFYEQRRFTDENFLAHTGLKNVTRVKDALVESLDRAGVLALAAGGGRLELQRNRDNKPILPASLNANGDNMPLLAALISAAVAPGFAVRKSRALLRTQQDTMAMVQSSSVVTLLGKEATNKSGQVSEIFAYTEATKNASKGGQQGLKTGSQLRGVTLVDPLGLLLFGVHKLDLRADGFLCDGWLPMSGNVDMLDDLARFKEVLNASLLRAFEGLGIAMLDRSQKLVSSGRANEYTAANEYEDSPESDGASALSRQELLDLENLAASTVEVLRINALENNLPGKFDLGRRLSPEDEYLAQQYPARISGPSGNLEQADGGDPPSKRAKPPKAEESYGEWDAWGKTPASSAQPVEDAPATSGSQQTIPAVSETSPPSFEKDTSNAIDTDEDNWNSWKPSATTNDAFQRRAAMTRRSSRSSGTQSSASGSSTRTVHRPMNSHAATPTSAFGQRTAFNATITTSASNSHAATPGSTAGHRAAFSTTTASSASAVNASGWLGANNLAGMRDATVNGWSNPTSNGRSPAAPKSQEAANDLVGPATPLRAPATIVEVPTRSGLIEESPSTSEVWTTGWMKYDRYNPRTRTNGASPTALRHRAVPLPNDENEYPSMPSGQVPLHRNEPASKGNDWDTFQPSRSSPGAGLTTAKAWASAGLVPPQVKRTESPAVSARPSRSVTPSQVNHLPNEPIQTHVAAQPSLIQPEVGQNNQRTVPVDSWDSWTPSVSAQQQGEENFNRRAAMSRGESLLPAPAVNASVVANGYTGITPAAHASTVQQDESRNRQRTSTADSWDSWTPSVSAQMQGEENYLRRQAMARGESLPPVRPAQASAFSNHQQSSFQHPTYQQSLLQESVRQQPESTPIQSKPVSSSANGQKSPNSGDDADGWASYTPKVVENDAYARRQAMSQSRNGSVISANNSFSSTSSANASFGASVMNQLRPPKSMSIIGSASRRALTPAERMRDVTTRLDSLNIRGAARVS